jgi:hypothetical protein
MAMFSESKRAAMPGWRAWAIALLIVAAADAMLYALGRPPICTCGTINLWHGDVFSSGNSQHLTDWYSPSHVLHGLVFYMVLRLVVPKAGLGPRFVAATLAESGWEVLENTGMMIDRYRETTIALGYYGDSIINSASDITMMSLGFLIATRAPVWFSVGLFLTAELVVGLVIRDGLILNVVMLVWPFEAILAWQAGR